MRQKMKFLKYLIWISILVVSMSSLTYAAQMTDYCARPPFIESAIPPNLLLMIDNSASMYDLAYQDPAKYCANGPTTLCTTDTQCANAGTASCTASMATKTETVYSVKACTNDSQCPNSSAIYAAKSCNDKNDCPNSNSCSGNPKSCSNCNTSTGAGDCVLIKPKCNAGFCNACDTTTGVGDCISTSTTTFTPITCTADSQCTASGGACPAGATCTWAANDSCNNKCTATRQCYDSTYSTSTTYAGYFDSAQTYSYDFTSNKFTGGATMPGACTYSAGTTRYVCVNTTGSGTSEKIVTDSTGFVATGNFLNWLTSSKFDIEKKILTGGKFDTTNNVLIAESRGCAGRKFIKTVTGVNLSFGIHGGTPGGISSTQNQGTEYGQTYIEIYAGTYNTSDCLAAMNDWMTLTTNPVNLGTFQNDTKGCVGAGNSQYNAINIWNHNLHNCYQGITSGAQGYSTNLNALEVECQNAYGSGVLPNTITDPNSGISICSSVLTYEYPVGSGNFQTGYLGVCYNGTSFDQNCAVTQMQNFCLVNVTTNPVVDPSSTVLPGTAQSVPGFILEQGLMDAILVGQLTVKIAQSTAPAGLIQDFQSSIRMGALTFNNNGSGTECGSSGTVPCVKACSVTTTRMCYLNSDCPSGESCINLTKTDGGKIVTYIGDPTGGHGTPNSLIYNIDAVPATTWTPFSEAFYTGMGYFARTNSYLSSPATSADRRLQTGTCSITTSKVCKSSPPDASWDCPALESCITGSDKGDYNLDRNPSQYKCQKNNILLITDGQSTADLNANVSSLVTSNSALLPVDVNYGADACIPYAGSKSLEALSWLAQNRNIQDISGQTPQSNSQKISTYVVYSGAGSLDSASCSSATLAGLNDCQPDQLMCKTAKNGGGSYYLAQDPASLYTSLKNAFTQIAASAASGTAASVLASGEGSGANLVQAIFYPTRRGSGYEVNWTGRLQNFWYYIDPRLGNSTIMEDTDLDKALKLSQDNAVSFVYDPSSHQTTVTTTSQGGVVTPNVSLDNVHYLWEAGQLLLSRTAGDLNTDAGARHIFTNTSPRGTCSSSATNCSATSDCPTGESCLITNHTLDRFDTSNAAALSSVVNVTDDASYTQTTRLIKYIRGTDDLDGSGKPSRGNSLSGTIYYQTDAGDTIDGVRARNRTLTQGTVTDVWKLGDIVDSTPKILSWVPLNTYLEVYSDTTYKNFTSSGHCSATPTQLCKCSGDSYPCSSGMTPSCPGGETCVPGYKSRGLVFAGGNDGMLHAFKLGLLGLYNDPDLKATLGKHCSTDTSRACNTDSNCASGTCATDTDLGQEMWAFIPKNSLPYLKYFADPNYCHIYYIDAQPFIFDASIAIPSGCSETDYWKCSKPADGSSWRTVLIGSMRLGGACKNSGDTCQDCTKTPMNNIGFSSYFALDITDPSTPQLLWEFSNPGLGFSTSGPAIVRVGTDNTDPSNSVDRNHNGRWLAVFGSGPTGWISQNNNMAIASLYDTSVGYLSNLRTMKMFVVDVATGKLVSTIDTGVPGAFAGSLIGATMDFDQGDLSKGGNYQDDAVYFGYTKWDGTLDGIEANFTTAQGGSANTIMLAAGSISTDDYYKGKFIELTKSDGAGGWTYQGVRLIKSFKGSTLAATVDSSWPVTPDGSGNYQYRISNGWTKGGVKRLLTNQDIDPTRWAVSTVIDSGAGMGPVTTSVKKLQNYIDNSVRLYFGSGRYYYRMTDILDDPSNLRALYGVIEPCFRSDGTVDPVCTTIASGSNIATGAPAASNLGDATSAGIDLTASPNLKGWWIMLDGCKDSNLAPVDCTVSGVDNPAAVFKAERVVTEPLAATSGAVFFSTITPTSDPCEYGGRSFLWAVRFDTGGTLVPFGILKGKAIIQRSTGEIEQIDLATAFTTAGGGQAGQRKTTASFGLTGSGGISIIVPPKPLNQILHIKKR